jgi:hypothetical protein
LAAVSSHIVRIPFLTVAAPIAIRYFPLSMSAASLGYRHFGHSVMCQSVSTASSSSAGASPARVFDGPRSQTRSWLVTRLQPVAGVAFRHPPGATRPSRKQVFRQCLFSVLISLVPGAGFEPATFGLQNRCTTTVLTRHFNDLEPLRLTGSRTTTECVQLLFRSFSNLFMPPVATRSSGWLDAAAAYAGRHKPTTGFRITIEVVRPAWAAHLIPDLSTRPCAGLRACVRNPAADANGRVRG